MPTPLCRFFPWTASAFIQHFPGSDITHLANFHKEFNNPLPLLKFNVVLLPYFQFRDGYSHLTTNWLGADNVKRSLDFNIPLQRSVIYSTKEEKDSC